MSRHIEISGVPDCIRLDSWWLETSTPNASERSKAQKQPKPHVSRLRDPKALGVLAFLVLLADWLFWRKTPGLSVALFVMVLSVAILALRQKRTTWKEWCGALAFQLVCNLPVIELLQPLSLLFSAAGFLGLAVWAFYGRIVEGRQMAWFMMRVSTVGAILLPRRIIEDVQSTQIKAAFNQHLMALAMSMVVGGVFLVLLTTANPLLERFLHQVTQFEFVSAIDVFRLVFWSACACVLWPYLHISHTLIGKMPTRKKPTQVYAPWCAALINVNSVRFFCFNDNTAIGVIAALRLRGFDVPRDFSVIGFDDIPFASNITPALTTIRQPRNKIGERAMAILLDGLEGQSTEKTSERLHGDLVVRESCGPAGRK